MEFMFPIVILAAGLILIFSLSKENKVFFLAGGYFLVLGAWLGGRMFHGLASEQLYRNVALAILFATGVFGLSRNFLLG